MSGDNRSVSTDALETLGMVHFRKEYRDAIHLAVEPITAGEDLKPGQDIYIAESGQAFHTRLRGSPAYVGIVDPFLPKSGVPRGEEFWLVVYPRRITSLRHVWSHPDFPEAE